MRTHVEPEWLREYLSKCEIIDPAIGILLSREVVPMHLKYMF